MGSARYESMQALAVRLLLACATACHHGAAECHIACSKRGLEGMGGS